MKWLARWYFVTYLKPLCDDYIKAQLAKAAMPSVRRHIGDTDA